MWCVWGGGVATLLKMGVRGMLAFYFVKIKMYLTAEITIIYQDLFLMGFFLQQLESFYRSCSVHVI